MRRTGALRVALLLLAALAGASEAFSPEMWTNLANWNFLYRNYITSVDPRNMPRTDASPEPTAPTPDVDVNVLSNDDDNNDSSGGSGVSARNVSLKAFLDVVPDMANHTIEDFLSDVEAASPPAEAQEPEGIVMNETLLASIRKCTKDFERESTNSTEAQPDTFAYDILQDFGSCITTSFDDAPYSNLTGIIDLMLQGFGKIFESIEDRTENETMVIQLERDLVSYEEEMVLDYIWNKNPFRGNQSKEAASEKVATIPVDEDFDAIAGAILANLSSGLNASAGPEEIGDVLRSKKQQREDKAERSQESGAEKPKPDKVTIAVSTIIVIGALCLGGVAGVGAYIVWRKHQAKKSREGSFSSLAPIAQSSLSTTGSDSCLIPSTPPSVSNPLFSASQDLVHEGTPDRMDMGVDAEDIQLDVNNSIGRGAFGVVYKALWKGREVAVKVLGLPYGKDEKLLKTFQKEATVLAKLSHDNIVEFYGACIREGNVFLVEEYMSHGSLHDALYKHKIVLSHKRVVQIAIDIASALSYLHPRLVHCDLKPRNILLDEEGTCKVADFGIAKFKDGTYVDLTSAGQGTPQYMAPELFSGGHISEKCDVYSLAMIMWECLVRKEPWKQMEFPVQVVMAVAVEGRRPEIPEDCPKKLERLITKCWQPDPYRRPSCQEVMKELCLMLEESVV